jgi:hypothetical protein
MKQKKQLSPKQRKALYWTFKLLSVAISCAFPMWAICEKYPVWTESHGSTHTVGVGLILILIVAIIIFRRTIFNFIIEKFNLRHAPPLLIWLVMLVGAYVLIYIGNFMEDLTTVLWMGLIGCAIGTLLTFIAENKFTEKKEE